MKKMIPPKPTVVAAPLTDLLRTKWSFVWTEESLVAFNLIKRLLCAPLLTLLSLFALAKLIITKGLNRDQYF